MSFVFGLVTLPAMLAGGDGLAKWATALQRIEEFPELDLLFYLIGLTLFYLQSRILENSADAGAVRLTGDPEAMITALLKLGRLNLMPIQWGRASGSLLTHPSTLKRVERIAKIAQVPAERLQQIIAQYQHVGGSVSEHGVLTVASEDTFSSEVAAPGSRIVTTARASQSALNKLWVLLFFHIAPALFIGYAISKLHLYGSASVAVYVGGAIACVAIYAAVIRWMGVWGRKQLQQQFEDKARATGLALTEESAIFVGFSPGALARYFVSNYNWDNGYLVFTKDRLCYVGDQISFVLRPDQIRNIRLDRGAPSWFPVPRVYFDWWDEGQQQLRTCNLGAMRPCAFWRLRQEANILYKAFCEWMANPERYPQAEAPLLVLKAPSLGEVTSRSPKSLQSAGRTTRMAIWITILAVAACTVSGVPATTYVCAVVLLLRVYEHLPYRFYKEKPSVGQSTMAMGAGAGGPAI
jgi:hypothetical protein